MKMLKSLVLVLLGALSMIGIYHLIKPFMKNKSNTVIEAHIVRNRVDKVFKMVTVEGNYSEIYDYKNYYFSDIWPLRKKALVKVNAKVLVGYDLNNIQLTIDSVNHIVYLNAPLYPEILSIDDQLDFYSFENGWFNMINNKDITEMGVRAKEFIRKKAEEDDLFEKAEEQKKELFDMLSLSLQAGGWELQFTGPPPFKG